MLILLLLLATPVFAQDPCFIHAHIKKNVEGVLFTELTEATIFAKEHSGSINELKSVDGKPTYFVQYIDNIVTSNFPDDCKEM